MHQTTRLEKAKELLESRDTRFNRITYYYERGCTITSHTTFARPSYEGLVKYLKDGGIKRMGANNQVIRIYRIVSFKMFYE